MANVMRVWFARPLTRDKGMLQRLAGGQTLVRVPPQQLAHEVHEVGVGRPELPLQRHVRRVDVPHAALLQRHEKAALALQHLHASHEEQTFGHGLQQRRGRRQQVGDGGVVEEQAVRVQLGGDAAQRPHVDALVDVGAQDDLRRAVGAALDVQLPRGQRLERGDEVAAAEVHQLDLRATREGGGEGAPLHVLEEDVLGLEVAVDDVVRVNELQRLQDLLQDHAHARQREERRQLRPVVEQPRDVVEALLQQLQGRGASGGTSVTIMRCCLLKKKSCSRSRCAASKPFSLLR